ncbi:MAG: sensor domain-containing diguanylate cyclase, partial [Dokdonella sp.]
LSHAMTESSDHAVLNNKSGAEQPSALEHIARPLLRLVQHITGMETSFITAIDWDQQEQHVLFSSNTGRMEISEGSRVDWKDSMCRAMFLAGKPHSCAVGLDVPATPGAIAQEMKSFFAVPILAGDSSIGTVCGASCNAIVLDDDQMTAMRFIAEALQKLLESDQQRLLALGRATVAEKDARDARSESKRHEGDSQRMERLANTDMLTGLPNRRFFIARWEDELARSGRRSYPIGLLLIDLDRFKAVNDTKGHLIGDAVLRAIGATLLTVSKTSDVVARLGGDEFALAISHSPSSKLLEIAENMRQLFAVAVAELGEKVTLSVGISSSEYSTRGALFADADKSLYQSKAAGGNTAVVFRE